MIATAAALLVAAVASTPAAAAGPEPITIGTGVNPRATVTPNGTAHVVWSIPVRGSDSAAVGYCRLRPYAAACDRTQVLLFPKLGLAKSGGDVTIQADGDNALRIVSACYGCAIGDAQEGIQRWVSSDAGTTFTPEPALGGTPTNAGMGPDGITLGNGVYVTPADGDRIIARPGMPDTTAIDAAAGASFVHSPSIVQVPGQVKLVYATSDLFGIRTALYLGTDFEAATLMNPGSWIVDIGLPKPESGIREPRLTAGAAGVWLSYEQKVPLDDHVLIRRFDPVKNTFSVARTLEGPGDEDASLDGASSAQDAGGRLHVVWRSTLDDRYLRYTRSSAGGASFQSPPATLARGEVFANPEVAAGPGGAGWAVWHGISDSAIRALPFDAPAGSSTTTGGGTDPTRVIRVSVPGATVRFSVPSGCVRRGGTFRVRLSWKRVKKKNNVFVKITRTDFYVGTKVAKRDRKAPFVQTLKVPSTAVRGGSLSVRARAFIKVKRGKSPKKSIRATIKICR
jgi:hypothetical protein